MNSYFVQCQPYITEGEYMETIFMNIWKVSPCVHYFCRCSTNSSLVWRPAPFALHGRGSDEKQTPKLCSQALWMAGQSDCSKHLWSIILGKSTSRLLAMWLPIKTIAKKDCITIFVNFIHRFTKHINWGEPERAPHWSNGIPRDVYIFICMLVLYVIP